MTISYVRRDRVGKGRDTNFRIFMKPNCRQIYGYLYVKSNILLYNLHFMGKKLLFKNLGKKQSDLEDRIFYLAKIKTGQGFRVSFPKVLASNMKVKTALPVFRRDKVPYTPGFSLPDQFNSCVEEEALHTYIKKLQNWQESSQLGPIEPKQTNSFCAICNQTYEDYKFHVNIESHRQKFTSSIANPFILELTAAYLPQIALRRIMSQCESPEEITNSGESSFMEEEELEQKFAKIALCTAKQ